VVAGWLWQAGWLAAGWLGEWLVYYNNQQASKQKKPRFRGSLLLPKSERC